MYKNIFLDLDDTILDFRKAEAAALEKTLAQMDLLHSAAVLERYHVINANQWALLEEGKCTREQALVRRFAILLEELGAENRSAEEACHRYEGHLSQGHWFMPGAKELLEELAPQYDLHLATNGTAAVQHSRLASAGIVPYFRNVFISQEIGFHKPRREFFAHCFAAIPSFSRKTALMVGDSLTSDIRGGMNAGIRTCWFNHQGQALREDIQPDYVITDLKQLPPLLAGESA